MNYKRLEGKAKFISLKELKKSGKIIKRLDDVIPNSLKKLEREQINVSGEVIAKLIRKNFIGNH